MAALLFLVRLVLTDAEEGQGRLGSRIYVFSSLREENRRAGRPPYHRLGAETLDLLLRPGYFKGYRFLSLMRAAAAAVTHDIHTRSFGGENRILEYLRTEY